jgi:predicted MFS family arabinose efflux permease
VDPEDTLRTSIKQNLKNTIAEYPRGFWMLMGINFINFLGNNLIFPFFALYISKKFGASMTQVGLLFTFSTISGFIGSTIGGAMTDRFGRKSMLILNLITSALFNLALGFAPSLYFCYGVALVGGVIASAGGPAGQAMIADLVPEEKRAGAFGIFRVVFNTAVAIGVAIGGLIATRSFLALFISDAVISSICAFLVYVFLKETKPEPRAGQAKESLITTFAGYLDVLKDKGYMLFLAAAFLAWLVAQNFSTTLGVFLRDVKGVPESGYGMLISMNAVIVILFQIPLTRRIEKFKPMVMMAIGSGLFALGYLSYAFLNNYALYALAMIVITMGELIFEPVRQASVASFAPEQMRGRYMAIEGHSIGIAYAVGPLLAGRLFDSGSPNWLWYAAGIVGAISAFMFLVMGRKQPAPVTRVVDTAT